MVYEHHLLTRPLIPAILANLFDDARADRAGKWRALESWLCLSATTATDVWHEYTLLAPRRKVTAVC